MNPDARTKARIWLAVVFIVGAAIGVVFGYSFGHRSYAATIASQPPQFTEAQRKAKHLAEMKAELGLDEQQTAKFEEIIGNTHKQMQAYRDEAEKNVDVVRQQARNQMRALLTPEQKPKFEVMVQRMDEAHKKQQQQQPSGK
jgi:Spy/CpxP family protein refolding chaperone